jgi:hypothetical protein
VEKQLAQYRRVIEQHLATAGNSKLFQHSEDIIRDGAHLFQIESGSFSVQSKPFQNEIPFRIFAQSFFMPTY